MGFSVKNPALEFTSDYFTVSAASERGGVGCQGCRSSRCSLSRAAPGRMRDELLNGEILCTLKEARIIIDLWSKDYNTVRPHDALGYRPPAPETILVPSTQFYQLALT